jgi:hypothetical protein
VTRARDEIAVNANSSVPSSIDGNSSPASPVSDVMTPSFNTTSSVGFGKKLPAKMRHTGKRPTGKEAHQIRKSVAEIKQHTILQFKEACMQHQHEVDLQKEAEAQIDDLCFGCSRPRMLTSFDCCKKIGP